MEFTQANKTNGSLIISYLKNHLMKRLSCLLSILLTIQVERFLVRRSLLALLKSFRSILKL